MTQQFYYVDSRNERVGPVSWEVLMQLHRAAAINDETLIASETEIEWTPFAQWQDANMNRSTEASTTPSAESISASSASSGIREKKPRKKVGKIERIVIRIILGFIVFLILFTAFLNSPLVDLPFLHQSISGPKVLHPEKATPAEIAKAIESMPEMHQSIPGASPENEGVMLLFTGENSALVRPIPDRPWLYQIDLTRYGVSYDRFPDRLGTRNALTVLLYLGTEFRDGRWHLIHAKGGSVDQVTKPGNSVPVEKITESISLEGAMWHGQWIVRFLNGESPNPEIEAQYAAAYRSLEESFVREHQKREAIRAQGIRLPE